MGRIETDLAADGALTIWLNNTARRNALDQGMLERLVEIFEAELGDPEIRLVIIRGREGTFCAGRDVSDIAAAPEGSVDMDARLRPVGRLARAVRSSPVPAVAMVEGIAAGLGVALVCWADFGVCAAGATFSIPEARIGIPPSFTAMSLMGVVGPGMVRDMIVTGRRIDAQTALGAGLVTRVFAEGAGESGLSELVAEVVRGKPAAIAGGRQILRDAGGLDFGERIDAAYAAALGNLSSDEATAGISAFRGRR